MTIAIASFGASLIGLLGMISLKFAEMKSGKKSFAFFEKTDAFFGRIFLKVKGFLRYFNARTANMLFHFVLESIEDFFIFISKKIHKRFVNVIDLVKGKGIRKDKGSINVSFFLKDIDKHKEELRKNKF